MHIKISIICQYLSKYEHTREKQLQVLNVYMTIFLLFVIINCKENANLYKKFIYFKMTNFRKNVTNFRKYIDLNYMIVLY